MKRYDTYKPTGIDWIGEVPETWHLSKMKYIAQYINGYAFKPTDWTDSGLPIIRIQDLTGTNDNPNYYDGQIPNKYLIKNGDVLISWAATLDSFVWDRGDAWLNQHIFKTVVNESEVDKRYFVWLSKVAMFNMNNENKHGIMMEHVTSDIFDNYCIPIPPLSEQSKIAAYLDERCAGIDKVLATQEKRISLLQELKQSEIKQAITHGLNPNVTMKDSGVEWIGMVPKHWEVKRIKYTGTFGNGLTYSPNDVCEEGVLVIRSSNIQGGKLTFEDNVFVNEAPSDLMVKKGDIIICSRNGSAALVGKSCYIDEDINATFGAFMMRYKPSINTKYGSYLFQTTIGNYKGLFATTTINQLTKDMLSQMFVPVASENEQAEIVKYLDRRCGDIDKEVDLVTKQIELLREYKQSFILEVVTGKRKAY